MKWMQVSLGSLESDEGTKTATDLCDIILKAILKEDNWELWLGKSMW